MSHVTPLLATLLLTLASAAIRADGYRVPGFDKANCIPLKNDRLRHPLAWKEKKLAELPPGRYHLRLHLQQAEIFAVTLK